METHRLASGAGQAFGELGDEGVEAYREIFQQLQMQGRLGPAGVAYDPYAALESEGAVLALVRDGSQIEVATLGDEVGVILPQTGFYIESGGQVTDAGTIMSVAEPHWEIAVDEVCRPAAGVIVHLGRVTQGQPRVGDLALAAVDRARRWDIMRNHTATHLLHAALRAVLGEHVRQAGSLVAPDRLRFDFTHPEAMTADQLDRVERMVNEAVLENYPLDIRLKPRQAAVEEGAMALFGETYGETVRTVSIGTATRFSYELCAGTHVPETGVIGPFLILGEGSVAAGVRRIEAITGRAAQALTRARLGALERLAGRMGVAAEAAEERIDTLLGERDQLAKEVSQLRVRLAASAYRALQPQEVSGVAVLAGLIPEAEAETLRLLTDQFRTDHPSGVALLATLVGGKPVIVASVSQDLVVRGLHAGELVKAVAAIVGGGGGGKPTLAQAGGKDATRLPAALDIVPDWVRSHLR
jgi:alanyl-tRNA synthetase